jgi:hypothetical protein
VLGKVTKAGKHILRAEINLRIKSKGIMMSSFATIPARPTVLPCRRLYVGFAFYIAVCIHRIASCPIADSKNKTRNGY